MKTVMLTVAVLGSLMLSACETVKGAGQDLQNASETVQKKF